MKKGLIITLSIFLALVLLAAGLFLWKGGHHAIVLAEILEEYIDTDDATQSVTVQVIIPGAKVDPETGRFKPHIQQYRLTCDTFWTEYADRPLFGLTTQGVTAYTDGKCLYMDTGKAYALPDLSSLRSSAGQLAWGLLLHGRLTKHGDTYELSMNTRELELYMDITADNSVRSATVMAVLPDDTAVNVSMTNLPATPHAIPQEVLDGIVRTKMEPPMALTEPLEVLLPALETLIPLEGELSLGVECGILELSESVTLRIDAEKAELERKGVTVTLELPVSPAELEPLPAALLLLRNGDFILDGQNATIRITLPPETSGALCAALVPQIEGLGMTFSEGKAELTITDGHLRTVTLNTGGEVPFLVSTIPLSFSAELKLP